MSFTYNERACKSIIELCKNRLKQLGAEIEFLQREAELADELAVRFAVDEALARAKFELSGTKIKVAEMEQCLARIP